MTTAVATTAAESRLPAIAASRGIAETTWRTLSNVLYPGAAPESVGMVWDYCSARKLDPLKKPVHIVPMEVKNAMTGKYEWRDVVLPGINEYRITAQRTGEYLGHDEPTYGPEIDFRGVKAPQWCRFVVYRWNAKAQTKVAYPVQTEFAEVVALGRENKVNARWSKAPKQMLTKCAEAAALRAAFPEELGGEPTAEEMMGVQTAEDRSRSVAVTAQATLVEADPIPEGYDKWLVDMESVADEGTERLSKVWKDSPNDFRAYLTRNDMATWERLKAKASEVIPQ